MSLWLEHRPVDGKVVAEGQFLGGVALVDDREIDLIEAVQLCRPTCHLQPASREWALRIRFDR